MKYVTLQQFLNADVGLPDIASLKANSPLTIPTYIARAEAAIDSYCDFSMLQGAGFEPHVIGVYSQAFDYGTRRTRFPLPIVPIRQALRYRILISTSSAQGGAPLTATLSPADVIFNEYEGYMEVVPLTAVTYAVAPVIAQLGLTQPIAQVDCEAGFFLTQLNDTPLADVTNKIFYASRGFWALTYDAAPHLQPMVLPPTPPCVYVFGVPQFCVALASAITAGTTYTSLPLVAVGSSLPTGLTMPTLASGATLIVSDGTGSTTTTITTTANVINGSTALPISTWTPTASYPAGTIIASGFAINPTEGQVIFTAVQNPYSVKLDYTYVIPDNVKEATIAQVTYMLAQRRLNQSGMAGVELARNGEAQIRRHLRQSGGSNTLDTETMAPEAMRHLAQYKAIAIG